MLTDACLQTLINTKNFLLPVSKNQWAGFHLRYPSFKNNETLHCVQLCHLNAFEAKLLSMEDIFILTHICKNITSAEDCLQEFQSAIDLANQAVAFPNGLKPFDIPEHFYYLIIANTTHNRSVVAKNYILFHKIFQESSDRYHEMTAVDSVGQLSTTIRSPFKKMFLIDPETSHSDLASRDFLRFTTDTLPAAMYEDEADFIITTHKF